ncbi:MinD/ParA family ATP-binding protein [Nocardia iowensis]|uniref:MinD/ParA family ATP-binding protein n=1 Tax=Nocardia iowensis TaxID=204891 RepID=UPI001FE69FB8|nr:MinD/ParA family protein [Nocardia iowensis]
MSRNNDGLPMLPPWLSESEVTQVGYEAPVQNLPPDELIEEGPSRRRGRFKNRAAAEGERSEAASARPEKRRKGWRRDKNDEQPAAEQQPNQVGRAPESATRGPEVPQREPELRAPQPDPRAPRAPQPDSPDNGAWRQPGPESPAPPSQDDAWQAGPPQRAEGPALGLPTRNPGPPPPAFQPLGRRADAEAPVSNDATVRHQAARPDLPPPPAIPEAPPSASTGMPAAPAERSAPAAPEPDGPPPWLAGPRPEQGTAAPADSPRRPPLPEPPAPQGNPPGGRSAMPPAEAAPSARLDEPTAPPRGVDGPPPWLAPSDLGAARSAPEQAERPSRRGPELPPPPGEFAAPSGQTATEAGSDEPADTGPTDAGPVGAPTGEAPSTPDSQTSGAGSADPRRTPAPGDAPTPEDVPGQSRTPSGDISATADHPGTATPEHGIAPQNRDRVPGAEQSGAEHGSGTTTPGLPPQRQPSPGPADGSAPAGPTAPEHGQRPPGGAQTPSTAGSPVSGPLGAPQTDRPHDPAATPQAPAAEYPGPNGTGGPRLPGWQAETEQPDPVRQAPGWVTSSGASTGPARPVTGRHRLPADTATQPGPEGQPKPPTEQQHTPVGPVQQGGPAGGQAPGPEQPRPQAPGEQWRAPAAQAPTGEFTGHTPPVSRQAPVSAPPGPQAPGEQWRHTAPTSETPGPAAPFAGGQAPGSEHSGPQAPQQWRSTPPVSETEGQAAPFAGGQAPSNEQIGPPRPGEPWHNPVGPASAGHTPPFAGGQAPGSEQHGPQGPGGFVGGQAPGPQAGQWGQPQGRPQHPGTPGVPPQYPPGVQYQQGPPPSLDDVPMRRAKKSPGSGWRKAVHHVSGGAINPGLSAEERRLQELVARIRQPVRGDYRIAVLSLKGGVGKTTTTMGIGSIFASIRGDRVIAVDANPDFGTLSQRVPLQTRSTVRDLLLDPSIQRYSDVRRHTSQATSRLEVLASERDPAASEAFSEDEYRAVARILQRFYNIILTDCGTGLMHSAMSGVLDLAHSLVLISSPAIDGARSAAATLDWLSLHGHDHLVRNAVVVINSPRAGSPNVGILQLREYFLSRCRAVHIIPFDTHMSEGAEIDLHRLHKQTKRAYVELAATIADDFATDHRRYHP